MKLRREVLLFAQAMEWTLRKNDDKGGWKECGDEYLLRRATEERRELRQAMNCGDEVAIRNECVDTANFYMMLFSNHGGVGVPCHIKAKAGS